MSVNSSSSTLVGTPSAKDKSPTTTTKPPNVFSDDGSFLDRIRRSMKEEDDKQKEKQALERKLHFADRFKNRGKRRAQSQDPDSQGEQSDDTPEQDEESPRKKARVSDGVDGKEESKEKSDNSAQAEYQKAMDSYPVSLKDNGTGVRSLVK